MELLPGQVRDEHGAREVVRGAYIEPGPTGRQSAHGGHRPEQKIVYVADIYGESDANRFCGRRKFKRELKIVPTHCANVGRGGAHLLYCVGDVEENARHFLLLLQGLAACDLYFRRQVQLGAHARSVKSGQFWRLIRNRRRLEVAAQLHVVVAELLIHGA